MKKKVYIVVSVFAAFLIIAGVMLSKKLTNKNTQKPEIIGKVEEIQEESNIQALETEPQVPETWDLNKVNPVLSEDNIYVPVPKGWSASSDENERYVNGNIEVTGSLSDLTFTGAGDYPWTQNADNIWVSGNKGIADSTSELVSNEIEVGENGGWVQIEWSVCSQSGYDVLYMYINDIVNGTTEQLPKEITGTLYGTAENSLIYTKCGKELAQGTYTISVKYSKYNNTTHTGLDSGYVKSGTYIDYDENGTDTLNIHKAGGFVVYEGTEEITDLWTASKERNQFVWVPVTNPSRIYERNNTTGKIKAKLWYTTTTGRAKVANNDNDNKAEAGVMHNPSNSGLNYDVIKNFNKNNLSGYTKDTFYKELETEYKKAIESIEKYGGFYIGRYETGNVLSQIPVVRRMNTIITNQSWYTMYQSIKNISKNKNIQTSMIWGSLWDETLEWIIETGEKSRIEIAKDVTSWGNHLNATFKYYNSNGELVNTKANYSNTRIPTGSAEYAKANNIYDLVGNVWDLTLEKGNDISSVHWSRGGGHSVVGTDCGWGHRAGQYGNYPDESKNYNGFRSFFYIK